MKPTAFRNDLPERSSEDSTVDVTALLHDYATSMRSLSAPIRNVLNCMGTAPFEAHGEPRCQELLDAVRPRLGALVSELRAVSPGGDMHSGPRSLLVTRMEAHMQEASGIAMSHHARAGAKEVLVQIAADDSQLHSLANEIIRVSIVAELLKTESQIIEIAEQARALRDVAVAEVASPEMVRTVDFMLLVMRAVDNARSYAESRRIDLRIRKKVRSDSLLVKVHQSDMQRALSNLLSNAIKYSYDLPEGEGHAWVNVDVYKAGGHACAQFESWGVPIVPEDFDRLFTPRYRGLYALEKGKAGTGMGLWDARKTARRHGGDVTITSRPARPNKCDPASDPYLTRAVLSVACSD
ncbi:MAG TPA: HAMP domain-containing sensor histidine kinase [Kofleriaceae bacterium]